MEKSLKANFTFSPRILLLLGEQLIKNEKIAITELIKNSYDADSNNVKIDLKSLEFKKLGKIIIEDDGTGMDKDTIQNIWLKPGTNNKRVLVDNLHRTKKFKRLPLGEKGVGRLGVHKLGSKIEIITKSEGNKEIYFSINWNDFERLWNQSIEEVTIDLVEREAEYFKNNNTGTKIIISDLKTNWNFKKFKDVYTSINSFNSPFSKNDSFKVVINSDKKEWVDKMISIDDIISDHLYEFEIEIEGTRISKFRYNFKPWSSLSKVKGRRITEDNDLIKKYLNLKISKDESLDLNRFKIGKISFKGLIYDQENTILKLEFKDPSQIKEYLNENGGIRIYREGMRIYDYGEQGNDWLGLNLRRVNMPASKVSNNIILGAIDLSREYSTDLIEKTNREGFVENDAFNEFFKAIMYSLDKIELFRNEDKEKIRTIYGSQSSKEMVKSPLDNAKESIEKKVTDEKLKKSLINSLNKAEKEFDSVKEILMGASSNGLQLTIVIHEVDKIMSELNNVIKNKDLVNIEKLFNHLTTTLEGYKNILKISKKEEDLKVKAILDSSLFNVNYRLKTHNINVSYGNIEENLKIKVKKSYVMGSITNLIDNSIWWLEYTEQENKEIFISVIEKEKYIEILIGDNGPGLNIDFEYAIKPFASGKPNDAGMGIGLHLVDQIMKAHNGELKFYDETDLFPNNIKGLKLGLRFKK